MKNLLLITFFLTLVCAPLFGQYSINKHSYNAQDYFYQTGDRYDPTIAGVTSLLFPGLGQVVAGETGRGLLFFGGTIVSTVITLGSITRESVTELESGSSRTVEFGSGAYIGFFASLGIWVWSIFDAVKVAKVNNLAYRDRNKVGLHNFSPALIQNPNNGQLAAGLGFRISLN